MSPQNLPAVTLDHSVDGEYTLFATDRLTGRMVAAAMSYDCEVATTRLDIQLIELGYQIYASDNSEFY